MNSEDLIFILHEKFPELLSAEEKEDIEYKSNSGAIPDYPENYRSWYMSFSPAPEASERREFEARPPAMGLTNALLDELLQHANNPKFSSIQNRKLFHGLREKMLRNLIPCSDIPSVEELCAFLRAEIESGIPSPVPKWYVYSTVTMGPRKIGYYSCCKVGCLRTEDFSTKFMVCGSCNLAPYCSRECQVSDWKARHKKICSEGAERREQTKKVGKMMQMLSDMSMTGQGLGLPGDSLADMLMGAATNPAVRKRREDLKAEKKRPK